MSEKNDEVKRLMEVLSKRDGQDLSCLDKAMQKSYRHNAELYYQELHPPVAEEVVELEPETPVNQCPECKGKKIIEYRAGLFQATCPACDGTGEVSMTEEIEPIDTLKELEEALNDGTVDNGTHPDDKPTRSKDTGKSKQSKKPAAKKKVRKASS